MIAAFAASDSGKVFGRVCERYGLDPGAVLEDDDDVLAFNLRTALALADSGEDEPEESPFDKARRMTAEAFG